MSRHFLCRLSPRMTRERGISQWWFWEVDFRDICVVVVNTIIVNCHCMVLPSVDTPDTYHQEEWHFSGKGRVAWGTWEPSPFPKERQVGHSAVGALQVLSLGGEEGIHDSCRAPGHQAQLSGASAQMCPLGLSARSMEGVCGYTQAWLRSLSCRRLWEDSIPQGLEKMRKGNSSCSGCHCAVGERLR